MFAILAAVVFGLAFLLEVLDEAWGDLFTPRALMFAGLLFLALHLVPSWRGRRWWRR